MPFKADIYRVMIASPSDVAEARGIVRRAIEGWNAANSIDRHAVLFPVGWETASAPALGDRAQAVINDQLGICDVLVGVFWTRLGTPTGSAPSGTIEEIERHIANKSLVMLYFCNKPASPDSVDPDQLKALKDARRQFEGKGLIDSYDDLADLESKLFRALSLHMNKRISHAAVTATPSTLVAPNPPTPRVALSDAARDLLREAVKDANGMVLKVAFIGGMSVQTNGRQMLTSNEPRERAKWLDALEELVNKSLLAPQGYKGEVFRVTAEGFRVGDSL